MRAVDVKLFNLGCVLPLQALDGAFRLREALSVVFVVPLRCFQACHLLLKIDDLSFSVEACRLLHRYFLLQGMRARLGLGKGRSMDQLLCCLLLCSAFLLLAQPQLLFYGPELPALLLSALPKLPVSFDTLLALTPKLPLDLSKP